MYPHLPVAVQITTTVIPNDLYYRSCIMYLLFNCSRSKHAWNIIPLTLTNQKSQIYIWFISEIFTLNDNTSSTTPVISNYYCPISSSSVSPTSLSSYSSDITTSTLSETTYIAFYSLDSTMISTELLSSQCMHALV